MTYNYFYIDDDPIGTITETAKGLSIKDEIIVTAYQHETWDNELSFLKEKINEFDGVILDWKLKGANANKEKANYNIEALAQQIRTLVSDKIIVKDFPIILCSAEFDFKETIQKNSTPLDLFDIIYEKEEFDARKEEVITQLFSLANSYKILTDAKTINSILGEKKDLDYRLKDYLSKLITEETPIHNIVRFVLRKIIEIPGLLINDKILASRLGVDIIEHQNDKNWEELLGHLKPIKYGGVLSEGWYRWWAKDLMDWWRNTFNCELGNLNAEKRVEMLNSKFNIELKLAKKTKKSKSTFFWEVCKKTGRPIAINDAILSIEEYEKMPWQADEYYSIDSALEEAANKIHPLDRDKVQKLKEKHTKTREKNV